MSTKIQRENRTPNGLFGNLSFRIPADEWLSFKAVSSEHFKTDTDAAREAVRLFLEKYQPSSSLAS